MEYIKRHIEDTVLKLSKSYPAILITGSRQSGKTTMLKYLAKKEGRDRAYVSLDDLQERDLAQNDPALFFQIHKPPVIIDEVQYAPQLFTYVKIHIDDNHTPGDFWLTGSQVFSLMRDVNESLAGRVALLSMSSLSRREIIGKPAKAFKPNFDELLEESKITTCETTPKIFEYIWTGSMPGLIGKMYDNRDVYYSSYISTFLLHDAHELIGGAESVKFNRFLTSVAARDSQTLNYNAIAVDADIDVATAKTWINVLETLGIIFMLHPYSNNVLKRTVKTPKLYFYDTGLVCYLTKWSSPEVAENGAMSGALFENYTVSEIIKNYQAMALEPYLYYYRDRDGTEIDVVMEADGTLFPMEIKKSALPDKRITRTFNVLTKSNLKIGVGCCLCMAENFSAFDKDNLIVPISLI